MGVDGENRPISEPTYHYELRWAPMTMKQAHQIWGFWREVSSTGTACIVLPVHPSTCIPLYTGISYCGVLFDEPRMESFWEEHLVRVSMAVRNIRV